MFDDDVQDGDVYDDSDEIETDADRAARLVEQPAPQYNWWQAVDHGNPIITVIAVSEVEAMREIIRQLDRPGRRVIMGVWMNHGCQVVRKEM